MKAQILRINELTEIIMVCKDKNLEFTVFQDMTPSFEGLNNGRKFLIVRFIPYFYGDYLLRKKNN